MTLPAFNPFGALMAKVYGTALALALAVIAVLLAEIEGPWVLYGYKEQVADLVAEKAQRAAAEDEADRLDDIRRTEDANRNHSIVAQSQQDSVRLRGQLDAALDRLAAANAGRLRSASCGSAPGGGEAAPLRDGAPLDGGGTGDAADWVAITRENYRKLGHAAMYGAKAQPLFEALIAAGLVAVEDLPQGEVAAGDPVGQASGSEQLPRPGFGGQPAGDPDELSEP